MRLWFFAAFALVVIVNFLTRPYSFYRGDAIAIRLAATKLVLSGESGLTQEDRAQLVSDDLFAVPEQYFHFNEERQRYYPRWGHLNVLLFAVPEFFRNPSSIVTELTDTEWANLYNILWSLLIAFYLLKLCLLFSPSRWKAFAFLPLTFYATFYWQHLRSQTYEIFQMQMFLGFCYHGIVFLRNRAVSRISPHFLAMTGYAALLYLVKPVYGLLLIWPPILLFWMHRQKLWKSKSFRRSLAATALIFGAAFFFEAICNQIRWGTMFPSEKPALPGQIIWSLSHFPERLYGYLFGIRTSVFFFFPLLIPALFYFRKFFRRFKKESLFLAGVIGPYILVHLFFYTDGQACIGPRYFVAILPVLGLPLLLIFESGKRVSKIVRGLFILLICTASFWHQWQVNSLESFAYLWISDKAAAARSTSAVEQIKWMPVGVQYMHLKRYVNGDDQNFLPIELHVPEAPPEIRNEFRRQMVEVVRSFTPCNFAWEALCAY